MKPKEDRLWGSGLMWGLTTAPAGLWLLRRSEFKRRIGQYVRLLRILEHVVPLEGDMAEHMEKAHDMSQAFELLDAYFWASLTTFMPPLDPLLSLEYGCYFLEVLQDTVDVALLDPNGIRPGGSVS